MNSKWDWELGVQPLVRPQERHGTRGAGCYSIIQQLEM
jgi:hypothetical protein